jgi:hypothetical protein
MSRHPKMLRYRINKKGMGLKKKQKVDVVVNTTIQDKGNDPAVQEKAKKAVTFLKKHPVPKSTSKSIK